MDNKIKYIIEKLNKVRRKGILGVVLSSVILGIGFLGFFAFPILAAVLENKLFFIFFGLAFLIEMFSGILLSVALTKPRNIFIKVLLEYLGEKYYQNFSVNYKKYIPKSSIKDKKILKKYKEDMPGFYYSGNVFDLSFETSYFEFVKIKNMIPSERKGRIIIFKLPNKIDYSLLIESKSTKANYNDDSFKKVNTEINSFNEKYNFYVKDTKNAYKILTPSFLAYLNDFINNQDCKLNLLCEEEYAYALIYDYSNRFVYKLTRKVDLNYIEDFLTEVKIVYDLAKAINLLK